MKPGLLSRVLSALFKRRDIVNCEKQIYLQRWFVIRRAETFAVFIHRFERSDEDRALHDHPWDFIVIPLWRGYVEHNERQCSCPYCADDGHGPTRHGLVSNQTRVYPLLGTRFRRAEYRHRVELIDGKPSWSLFIRFNRRRTWGFWLIDGFKAWNLWWQEKCE